MIAMEGGTFCLEGGIFKNNKATEGGVGFFKQEDTQALVTGGNYSRNKADKGGVFYADENTIFNVSLKAYREKTRQLVFSPFDREPFSVFPSAPRRGGDTHVLNTSGKG